MKGAILIVGSLLWDPDQDDKLGFRKAWRDKRLIIKDKIHVKVPIRYGRMSGKAKKKNFTMVFSKECETENLFGTAYLVPLKNWNIRTFKGIENQARFLSEAEGSNDNKLSKGNKEKWGTISIMINPKIEKIKKNEILQWWKELVEKDGGLLDHGEYKVEVGDEKSVLSDKGELLINWPQTIDKTKQVIVYEIDFILATCTKSKLNKYPKIDDLHKNISNDERRYFYLNIENGITTFQDRNILEI